MNVQAVPTALPTRTVSARHGRPRKKRRGDEAHAGDAQPHGASYWAAAAGRTSCDTASSGKSCWSRG